MIEVTKGRFLWYCNLCGRVTSKGHEDSDDCYEALELAEAQEIDEAIQRAKAFEEEVEKASE